MKIGAKGFQKLYQIPIVDYLEADFEKMKEGSFGKDTLWFIISKRIEESILARM